MDGQAQGRRTTQSSLNLPAGQLSKNEPAARACATVGEYHALPGLDATTRRQRRNARAAARPWRLDVGCPGSWRPSRGSRSRVLEMGKTTKSRAGHGVAGLCRAQPTEATRRRAGEDGAPITSAPRLDLDSQAAIIVVCLLWLRKRPLVRVRARTLSGQKTGLVWDGFFRLFSSFFAREARADSQKCVATSRYPPVISWSSRVKCLRPIIDLWPREPLC